MDREEAKLILADKTLGDLDSSRNPDDPKVQEAFRLIETDTELERWWKSTVESDRALREQFAAFEPPTDLKASLHASLEQQAKGVSRRRKIIQWMSIAASLVLVGIIGSNFLIDRTNEFQGPLEQTAVEYSMYGPRLKFFDTDSGKLVDWLRERNIAIPSELPTNLLQQEGIGCRPLDWSENKVAILCFNADTVYHLFIGKDQDFSDFKDNPNIEYRKANKKWTTSSWRSGDHVFVLTAKATIPDMKQMLASYTP